MLLWGTEKVAGAARLITAPGTAVVRPSAYCRGCASDFREALGPAVDAFPGARSLAHASAAPFGLLAGGHPET